MSLLERSNNRLWTTGICIPSSGTIHNNSVTLDNVRTKISVQPTNAIKGIKNCLCQFWFYFWVNIKTRFTWLCTQHCIMTVRFTCLAVKRLQINTRKQLHDWIQKQIHGQKSGVQIGKLQILTFERRGKNFTFFLSNFLESCWFLNNSFSTTEKSFGKSTSWLILSCFRFTGF